MFFQAPPVVQTEVFASVPDRLRKKGQPASWIDANHPGSGIDCFLEGPAFDRAGNLYMVDIPFGRILRMSPAGEFDVAAEYDGWPNGLAVHQDGRIFIAYSASASWTDDYAIGMLTFAGGNILCADAWTKARTPILAKCPEVQVFGPGHNSFVKSPDGSEDWIVYHAIGAEGGGWAGRSVRAQRCGWSVDGHVQVGAPVGPGIPIEEPSGSPAAPASILEPIARDASENLLAA